VSPSVLTRAQDVGLRKPHLSGNPGWWCDLEDIRGVVHRMVFQGGGRVNMMRVSCQGCSAWGMTAAYPSEAVFMAAVHLEHPDEALHLKYPR
jgi:hypothetical protein